MRMRKKKWAEPFIDAHPDRIYRDPSEYKGKWHQLLDTSTIRLEIGCGKGGYSRQMALLYPEDGYIGLEKDVSAAAVSARKVEEDERPYPKLRYIVNQAANLRLWFAKEEVDIIHLNFSDPWPKKGEHKRRLSSKQFLEMYDEILRPEGMILMKTDNVSLFEDSVVSFMEYGFEMVKISVDYRRDEHDDPITEYEEKFLALHQPIYFVCVKKRNCDTIEV